MAEERSLNLEPIGEKDLDTEHKFGTSEAEPTFGVGAVEKERREEKVGEKETDYQKILTQVKSSPNVDDAAVKADAKQVAARMDAETQVQHLVEIALSKGIVHAVKVAQHMDYYSMDKLHDTLLTDELHKALVDKGLLEEI